MDEQEKVTLENAESLGKRLGLSKRQIFRLNSAGMIPAALKIGGSVRWSSIEVNAWIASGCPDRETWQTMQITAEGGA